MSEFKAFKKAMNIKGRTRAERRKKERMHFKAYLKAKQIVNER
jgi:hypothetical protein